MSLLSILKRKRKSVIQSTIKTQDISKKQTSISITSPKELKSKTKKDRKRKADDKNVNNEDKKVKKERGVRKGHKQM